MNPETGKCDVPPPRPWVDGDNLPWHDPGFSERMLKEHLSQHHDLASRRFALIDKHVQWIDHNLLCRPASRILDLGCGPGFYLHRLALRGHAGEGIDYSPASIAYAREAARRESLRVQYRLEDMRRAELGSGFDLVMLIWGEFNVFSPQDAEHLLGKMAASLADDGRLLLEVHTFDAIRRRGQLAASQYTRDTGLFCDCPHQYMQDAFWHADLHVATTRYRITEQVTGKMTVYAASYQAYTDAAYDALIRAAGFRTITRHGSLTGERDETSQDLLVLMAEK